MRLRRITPAILFAVAGVGPLFSQTPASVDFPHDPQILGRGSAAAASRGLAASALNPAAVASASPGTVAVSAFSTRGADERGASVRAALGAPGNLRIGLEFHTKGVRDLIDDPTFDESGFRVGDTALRMVLGRHLLGDKVALGAGVTSVWSDVLDTSGRATFVDLGATIEPRRGIRVGVSARRLGGNLRFTPPLGAPLEIELENTTRVGVELGGPRFGELAIREIIDFEFGSTDGTERAMGILADYGPHFALLLGVRDQPASSAFFTAGVVARIRGVEISIAYESVDFVGPRLALAASWIGSGARPD